MRWGPWHPFREKREWGGAGFEMGEGEYDDDDDDDGDDDEEGEEEG